MSSLVAQVPGEVARIEVVMYADSAVAISGNVGDVKLAKGMLEAALEAVSGQVRASNGGLLLNHKADVVEHSEFPLVEVAQAVSGFIGAAKPTNWIEAKDHRIVANAFTPLKLSPDPVRAEDFTSPWWPRRCGICGDNAVDNPFIPRMQWENPETNSGMSSRFGIVGVTRDVYGSPLGNCAVRCFDTTTNVLVSETTSDVGGVFLASTPNLATHYLVSYKAGSPDVEGTTVNTLIGGQAVAQRADITLRPATGSDVVLVRHGPQWQDVILTPGAGTDIRHTLSYSLITAVAAEPPPEPPGSTVGYRMLLGIGT